MARIDDPYLCIHCGDLFYLNGAEEGDVVTCTECYEDQYVDFYEEGE